MGRIREYIKMALKNVRANKGRSFLTMLGIIIGISSVIMILAVGAGVTDSMNEQLEKLAGGQAYFSLTETGYKEKIKITDDDLRAVENIDGVETTSPSLYYTGKTRSSKGNFDVIFNGGNAAILDYSPGKLLAGRYFTNDDVAAVNKVCVITREDAVKMFGSEDVVGMTIETEDTDGLTVNYRIIGVMKMPDNTGLIKYDNGDKSISLYMPWTTLTYFNLPAADDGGYTDVMVYMDKTKQTKPIVDKIMKILNNRHQVPEEETYFKVENFQDSVAQINQVLQMLTIFIVFVAAISLLVGGIGVMNIMLVSVTERTREIGIRKSLGARTGSIMMQFLAESAFLTFLGGLIGIILGLLGARLVGYLVGSFLKSPVIPVVSPLTIFGVVLFSSTVGIFFGLYPARKAAKMNPIVALRRE